MPPTGNPYDDIDVVGSATAAPAAPAGKPANPYDDIDVIGSGMVKPDTATQLRASVSQASSSMPQTVAARRALAKYVGLPGGVADAIPEEIKRMATVKRVAEDTSASPTLQKAYANPQFAQVAHDDSGPLSAVADAIKWLVSSPSAKNGGMLGGVGSQVSAATQSGLLSLVGVGAKLADELNPFTLSSGDAAILYRNDPAKLRDALDNSPATLLSRVSRAMQEGSELATQGVNENAKAKYGSLKYATLDPSEAAYLSPTKVVSDAIQSLPTTLALAFSAYFTRGKSLQAEQTALASGATQVAARQAGIDSAAATMARTSAVSEGAIGYGQQAMQTDLETLNADLSKSPAYAKLVKEGYSPEAAREVVARDTSQQAGQIAGIVDAVTNAVGGKYIGKAIGEGGKLTARVLKGAGEEALTEFVQSMGEQFGQNWAEMLGVDPASPLLKDVLESGIQGLVVGGLTGGAFTGVMGRHAAEQSRMEQADASAQGLADLFKRAADAQTRTRDPETFANLVQQMADDGNPGEAPTSVYVDGRALAETLQANPEAAQVFNQMPEAVRSQVEEAVATGGAVEIPIGELTARATGTPLEAALLPHLRTTLDGLSQTEAKDAAKVYEQELQQHAERVIAESEQGDQIRAEGEQIRQLVTDAQVASGRVTKSVADVNARLHEAFFTAMAGRTGTTPMELFKRFDLKVQGDAAGSSVNAMAQGGDTYPANLPTDKLTQEQMLARGADGHLTSARERYIPIDKIDGLEPTPAAADERGYEKGRAITQPIEAVYDRTTDSYMLYAGNHRVTQAKLNGDTHIRAFVQPDRGIVGPSAVTMRSKTNLGQGALNQSAETATPTREEIDLRKRQKVLESLLDCLG